MCVFCYGWLYDEFEIETQVATEALKSNPLSSLAVGTDHFESLHSEGV